MRNGDVITDTQGYDWRIVQVLGNGQVSKVRVGSLAEQILFRHKLETNRT